MAVVLKTFSGIGVITTHFRTYFSGWIESDVHWGFDLDFDPWPDAAKNKMNHQSTLTESGLAWGRQDRELSGEFIDRCLKRDSKDQNHCVYCDGQTSFVDSSSTSEASYSRIRLFHGKQNCMYCSTFATSLPRCIMVPFNAASYHQM